MSISSLSSSVSCNSNSSLLSEPRPRSKSPTVLSGGLDWLLTCGVGWIFLELGGLAFCSRSMSISVGSSGGRAAGRTVPPAVSSRTSLSPDFLSRPLLAGSRRMTGSSVPRATKSSLEESSASLSGASTGRSVSLPSPRVRASSSISVA